MGHDERLARSAGVISGLTLLSRMLGVVREQIMAALLGAGMHSDAFLAALKIPYMMSSLLTSGALSAAFLPTYAVVLERDGRPQAHRLASRLVSVLAVVLLLGTAVAILGADQLIAVLAPGFAATPGKQELTARLVRILLPFLPLISLAAVARAMLHADERYGLPALAPIVANVISIAVGLALWLGGFSLIQVAVGWSLGTLLGGVAHLAIPLPAVRASGWRFRAEWKPSDPGLRRIAAMMVPSALGLAAYQVNMLVSTVFASQEPGAVSWLAYAQRVLHLPISIFGLAVGAVAGAGLARHAASGDMAQFRALLRRGLRLVAFLAIPSTVGLTVMSRPIVRLLFERGRFTGADTGHTADALLVMALGLVCFSSIKVLAPAFYALGVPRLAMYAGLASVAVNVLAMVTLYDTLGFLAVALGTALGGVVNVLILAVVLDRRLGDLQHAKLLAAMARMLVASLFMGIVAATLGGALEARLGGAGLIARASTALAPVLAGVLAYGLACRALRVPELDVVLALLPWRADDNAALS